MSSTKLTEEERTEVRKAFLIEFDKAKASIDPERLEFNRRMRCMQSVCEAVWNKLYGIFLGKQFIKTELERAFYERRDAERHSGEISNPDRESERIRKAHRELNY